jgi:hypothetical protein
MLVECLADIPGYVGRLDPGLDRQKGRLDHGHYVLVLPEDREVDELDLDSASTRQGLVRTGVELPPLSQIREVPGSPLG